MLERRLEDANPPLPLGYAGVTTVPSASGDGAVQIAGFEARPHSRSRTLWSAESYAAVVALCLDVRRALAELVAAGGKMP